MGCEVRGTRQPVRRTWYYFCAASRSLSAVAESARWPKMEHKGILPRILHDERVGRL